MFYPLPSVNEFTFLTEHDVQLARSPVVVVSTDNVNSTAYKLKPYLAAKDQLVAIPGATHETVLTHPETVKLINNALAK
ncbi:hypothetical protein GCM10027577_20360 [Spirosoma fluminis]